MVLTLRPLTRVSVCAYLIFSWILLAASLIRQFLLISTVSSFIINETQTQWNSVDFPVLLVVVWTLMQTSVEANVTVAVLITVKWIEHPFHLQTVLHTTYWLCAETLLSHVCLTCLYIQFFICLLCLCSPLFGLFVALLTEQLERWQTVWCEIWWTVNLDCCTGRSLCTWAPLTEPPGHPGNIWVSQISIPHCVDTPKNSIITIKQSNSLMCNTAFNGQTQMLPQSSH